MMDNLTSKEKIEAYARYLILKDNETLESEVGFIHEKTWMNITPLSKGVVVECCKFSFGGGGYKIEKYSFEKLDEFLQYMADFWEDFFEKEEEKVEQ